MRKEERCNEIIADRQLVIEVDDCGGGLGLKEERQAGRAAELQAFCIEVYVACFVFLKDGDPHFGFRLELDDLAVGDFGIAVVAVFGYLCFRGHVFSFAVRQLG
jgi:hypothetical protein